MTKTVWHKGPPPEIGWCTGATCETCAGNGQPQAHGDAAIKTLVGMGYTYHGGEQWKPPLGKPPRFLHEAQPQAQKPVAFGYVNTHTGQFFVDVENARKNNEGHWRTVYTAPSREMVQQARDAMELQRPVVEAHAEAAHLTDGFKRKERPEDWKAGVYLEAIAALAAWLAANQAVQLQAHAVDAGVLINR